jgi:large subunit ribosomal protein LP0
MPKRTKKQAKAARWSEFQEACVSFSKVMFVEVDNVTSKQISVMRKQLRELGAKMIMGKNTHMKAAITDLITEPDPKRDGDAYAEKKANWVARPHLNIIAAQLRGNTGMIFTNGDLGTIKEILDSHVRGAPAKVGSVAPKDVIIQPGPTGMDPKQTGFFQALNIATKIVKAQIEITTPVTVITSGDKVTPSQAALLDKLKIMPFEYKMIVRAFMEGGKLVDAKVLSITPADIIASFTKNAGNLTKLSLGSGYIVSSAAPHLIINAFKNLAGAAIASDYDFPALAALKSAAASAPASGGAAAGGAAAAKPAEEAAPEPEEDVDMGDLFGGGEDDY